MDGNIHRLVNSGNTIQGIPRLVFDLSNSGMDTQDVRRANLKRVLRDEFEDNAADLARHISRSSSQLNDLLAGRKSFGEKFARAIEPLLKKPQGWLDDERTGEFVTADPVFIRSITEAAADREIPDHIKQSIMTLITSSPRKSDANS